MALLDGAELGAALVEHAGDAGAALDAFEPRCRAQRRRGRMIDVCFGDGAPRSFLRLFTGGGAGDRVRVP